MALRQRIPYVLFSAAILSVAYFLFVWPFRARAATEYHVTTGGSGSTCTALNPCSIQTAFCGTDCSAFAPGADDIVWVHGGTYNPPAAGLVVKRAYGTPGHPLIYRNYQNQEVIIDCGGVVLNEVGGVCFGVNGYSTLPNYGQNVWLWGFKMINSSTVTRYSEHGHVAVTNGSPTVTFVDGANYFSANPTSTVSVTNGSPIVTAVGQLFSCCSSWVGKRMVLSGAIYVIQSIHSNGAVPPQGDYLTLTTNYTGGTNASLTATIPGEWSNGTFTLDPFGTPASYTVAYCATNRTTCTLTANVTNATATYEAHFPHFDDPTPRGTPRGGIGNLQIANEGSKLINSWIYDTVGGTNILGTYGGGNEIYGTQFQYQGYPGSARGYGHGFYIENPYDAGEAMRSFFTDNTIVRPFYHGGQEYSTNTDVGWITVNGNSIAANGHAAYPSTTWPASGCCTPGVVYLGTAGSASVGCPPPDGSGSTKTLYHSVFDHNMVYNPTNSAFTLGGSKGSCNTTITYNDFITSGQPSVVNGATFSPLTISGNQFNMIPAGQGSPAPSFTQANYPNNTYRASIPSSGTPFIIYRPNKYESGRGMIMVDNPNSDPNVTVQLVNTAAPGAEANGAGVYVGEQYRIFNHQANDPWNDTPIKADTCNVSPCTVSLPTTLAAGAIRQPAFTDHDGTTPFPKPGDIGPRMVTFIVYPDWSLATTPTPSNTATNTRTPSNTPSLTPTPSFTPSPTSTATVTPSQSPTNSATPTKTATPTATFTPSRTPTRTQTPSSLPAAGFPASGCPIVSPMSLTTGVSDYPGSYVASASGNQGIATCTVTITTEADYYGFAKVYSADSTHDSFFYDVDGDGSPDCVTNDNTSCTHIFDTASSRDPNGCAISRLWDKVFWNPINDRSIVSGQPCVGEGAQRMFHFTVGTHVLTFRQRDAGTRLYYVKFSTDPGYDASDPPPTPTPGPHTCKIKCKPPGRTMSLTCYVTEVGPCTVPVPCPCR